MDVKKFEKIVEERFDVCRNILIDRAKQYCHSLDRLDQFKRISELTNVGKNWCPALLGSKHVTAFYDKISKGHPWDDQYDEKITDIINYLLLTEASLKEDL